MKICPKCQKELNDNAQFCDNCGTQVFETVFCPNCGIQTSINFAFCKNCGTPLAKRPMAAQPMAAQPEAVQPEMVQPEMVQPESVQPEMVQPEMVQPAAAQPEMVQPEAVQPEIYQPEAGQTVAPYVPKNKKQIPKKAILFGAIGIAVVAVLAIVLFIVFGGKASDENFALYIKSNEICYSNLDKGSKPWDLTSAFYYYNYATVTETDLEEHGFYVEAHINTSEDGKYIFFPDEYNSGDASYTLYYREVGKPKAKAIKIDDKVKSYTIDSAATLVTYVEGEENNLCQYKIDGGSTDKIASNITYYSTSADANRLVYKNTENTIYSIQTGTDKEKIATDVSSIEYVSEDLTCMYYIKEGTLYKYVDGSGSVKIASDVNSVFKILDSGEIYYLKNSISENLPLMDYIIDDLAESDATIVEPIEPTRPNWEDGQSYDEYKAAYDTYIKETYTAYVHAQNTYKEKCERDELRKSLAESTINQYAYTLCYFNGTSETVVTDSYLNFDTYDCAATAAVICYKAYNQANLNKVKFSEFNSVTTATNEVRDAITASFERYIAVKSNSTIINHDARNLLFNENGTIAYFIDNITYGNDYGDLYRISIENGVVGKAEVYDNGVCAEAMCFINESKIRYFKDYKSNKGDLYIDKERIDYDVCDYMINYYADSDKIFYFTDWNADKNSGTLKVYQTDQSEKIEDDVHEYSITSDNKVLYLNNYNMDLHNGELYAWENGETYKLDGGVVCIIMMSKDLTDGYKCY